MSKSIVQIQNDNYLYYNEKYSSRITRSFWPAAIIILIFWILELFFVKLSCNAIYYYKQAKTENLGSMEVKEWIIQKIWESFFDWSTFLILFMITIMVIIMTYFWNMKSYKLHRHKKTIFWIPLAVIIASNSVLLVICIHKTSYILRNFFVYVIGSIPYVTSVRMLFPFEISGPEKKVLSWFDFAYNSLKKI